MSPSRILRLAVLVAMLFDVRSATAREVETTASNRGAAPLGEAIPTSFAPRLPRAPLGGRLIVNGGFGDFRGGHFHAGFDFATSRRTGRPVRAPESGWIERVRSSGVGYGRALYLRTADGRLLEFGHLDAFAGSIAAYVDSAKVASGAYEQDLWPSRGRFRVKAGKVIAWTGESGAGGPHLHFEVRRGDIAYNPMRAGLALSDRVSPTLVDLTLEPLDDLSQVAGSSGPLTVGLARPETLAVLGNVRAIVRAYDRFAPGGPRVAPWRVGLEWDGRRTECRFDSVSWAADMPEADYVYDTGRVTGGRGYVLAAPDRFRPAVLISDRPRGGAAGTIEVRPGDPPRTLRLFALDLGGGKVARNVVIRSGTAAPSTAAAWWRGAKPWTDEAVGFASLPGGFLRLQIPLAAAKGGAEFQVGDLARRATRGPNAWSATFAVPGARSKRTMRLPIAVRSTEATSPSLDRGGSVWARHALPGEATSFSDSARSFRVDLGADALFEDAVLLAFAVPAKEQAGLAALGSAWRVEPSSAPLRRAARVAIDAPRGAAREKAGLYRLDGARWQWVGAVFDSAASTLRGESRRLGTFAILRDDVAPRIRLHPSPVAFAAKAPYSRWAIEATVTDDGSGVDAANSYIEVEARRVPTEWDPEARVLRWRPLAPPAPGNHAVSVVAADRAGNVAREAGTIRRKR